MQFNKLIPELSVFDIDDTVRFYQKLGFNIEYAREEDNFYFMSFEDTQFMFEQIHQDGWNTAKLTYPLGRGINFSITTCNIDHTYAHIKEQNISLYRELTTSTYRVNDTYEEQKEFIVQDPNGYLLRFTN